MPERSVEPWLRRHAGGAGVEVTAVETDRAQLVWADLPEGSHTLRVGHRTLVLHAPGGPGSFELTGLTPRSRTEIQLELGDRTLRRVVRTLLPPPGPPLFRFATISDLHLGRGDRHYRGPFAHRGVDAPPEGIPVDDAGVPARQLINARAAVDQALAWGAEHLIVKGDVTEETTVGTWDQAASLLGDLPVPVSLLAGNHDTGGLREFDPFVGAAERGLDLTRGVEHVDVPGLRIVLVDSTRPGSGWGSVARHADAAATLAAEADGGVFVATHHHPQRFRIPLFWPHGLPGPDARRFAATVVAANPNVLASSGHTHRNRRRRVAGMPWTEVAATNHFPAVWAGYEVHEGGIRQVVRRIDAPEVLDWSERTRHAFGGAWALWSAGSMSDRCFSLSWG